VWQWWEAPTVLEWRIEGVLGGWPKNNETCRRRGIWYPVFYFPRIVETVRILYLRFL